MGSRQALTSLAYALLKLGAVVYLFPIFWEIIQNPNLTGNIIISRLLIWGVAYLIITFIILVVSRENFNLFGFMIVLAATVYKIIQTFLDTGLDASMGMYFFVVCVCFYFMTKEFRTRRRMVAGGF